MEADPIFAPSQGQEEVLGTNSICVQVDSQLGHPVLVEIKSHYFPTRGQKLSQPTNSE